MTLTAYEASELVEIVRAFDDAVNYEADFDKAMRYAHADVVIRESRYFPYRAPYVGKQGLVNLMEDVEKWWDFPQPYAFTFYAINANLVIGRVTGPAVVRATGVAVDFNVTEWFTLVDKRIADIEVFYFDAAPLLDAARLTST